MPSENVETLFALAAALARASRELDVQGLSFAEVRLLAALIESPDGRRPTDLASCLHLTASGVTKNIEAGLLIQGGNAPIRAAEHVDALRASGDLVRLV